MVMDDLSMTADCERSSNQQLPGGDVLTTPKPTCPLGQLDCTNGNCYHPVEACNFVDDCGDGTDERDCSKSLLDISCKMAVDVEVVCDVVNTNKMLKK